MHAVPPHPPSAPPGPAAARSPWVGGSGVPPHPALSPQQAPAQLPKKGSKAKDLSHVPCKFYKANSCTAGKACPFSHDLAQPGTGKPVCQWFAKGNCKFGHKCALAHVLPGQPLSFDRKNKRAAQQALREAQANGQDGLVTATNVTAQSPRLVDGNGLVQTLRQSVDLGRAAEFAQLAAAGYLPNGGGPASSSGASHSGDVDAIFGSPDSLGHRTPASSPGMQHRTLPDGPHSPLSFATFSQGPTATFIAPTTSALSHHFATSPNGRSSVAAQAMLSEQARRLSSTSAVGNGEPLSPPRVAALSRARLSFNGASPATDLMHPSHPSSPPLAVPGSMSVAGTSAGTTGAIFGTSPFSGSRGLFIPSSYDSNEDGFPRSPPVRYSGLPGESMVRSNSGQHHHFPQQHPHAHPHQHLGHAPWTIKGLAAAEEHALVDEEDDDEDGLDEAFLPSSLNDLLTPEEMRRRTLRSQSNSAGHSGGGGLSGLHGPSSLARDSSLLAATPPRAGAFADYSLNSKSVPADLLLAAGKPPTPVAALPTPAPSLGARSSSSFAAVGSGSAGGAGAGGSWGLLSSSVEGHNPSAAPYEPPTRSLLSQSRGSAAAASTTSTTASPILSSSVSTLDGQQGGHSRDATSSLLSAHLGGGGGGRPSLNGIYSASFNDAASLLPPPVSASSAAAIPPGAALAAPAALRYPQSGLSPNTNASLALPGSSLPGGLAAGLSRLHLVPPAYTGETPPSSAGNGAGLLTSYAAAAASPPSQSQLPAGSALARRMSTKTREGGDASGLSSSPSLGLGGAARSPLQNELLLHPAPTTSSLLRAPVPLRMESGLSDLSSGASAAGEEEGEGEKGEETMFDMEVA